jgi:hypothetical protein
MSLVTPPNSNGWTIPLNQENAARNESEICFLIVQNRGSDLAALAQAVLLYVYSREPLRIAGIPDAGN